MKRFYLFLLLLCSSLVSSAQSQEQLFEDSYSLLKGMLSNEESYSFKKGVFSVENAYLNGAIDTTEVNKQIAFYATLCNSVLESRTLQYGEKDRETVNKWASIYQVMCNPLPVIIKGEKYVYEPFGYDFNDVFGHQSKENLFVSKLLKTHQGNCRSLPYFYKILAEELGVDAHLALAPNHIYIKHRSEREGWYNTELTSGIFPIDAWITASGFVHVDAITNGVYMKALDNKESLALLLVDLAENYNAIFPENDGSFILKCAETALQAYPYYASALILQVETHKKQMKNEADEASQKELLAQLEKEYQYIHEIGYRNMPEEMYLYWLVSLKTEKKKYENKQLNILNQK